jgi:hypothetical protein
LFVTRWADILVENFKEFWVVVLFGKRFVSGHAFSGVPQPVDTPVRFSGCRGSQRLKPIRFSLHLRHR